MVDSEVLVAQTIVVQYVDDVDGSVGEDVSTVRFGLDGVQYEIDLCATNAERMRASLGEFVAAARRTGGRRTRSAAPLRSVGRSRAETAAIRTWAREGGYEVSDRGRISAAVLDAYDAR